ncbi:MAG TPA: hypothetical protein PK397_08505 [Ignavibacteriaceae bacterium]|nr:hypothetical protein [Ignavibacteriaceae bacterium]
MKLINSILLYVVSIIIFLFSTSTLTAQIRYVSKTGSSTPPYTSGKQQPKYVTLVLK